MLLHARIRSKACKLYRVSDARALQQSEDRRRKIEQFTQQRFHYGL